ncbi:CaiB/BaiF CoA transferase family protein [Mesorhizobium australicum]|uniref:Crotonobetainyl-CoA:carnitine CoA-transferase CaiB n=1 Tax=Mesorhizobium australicum TaxID=536018 RepID=A0A1X7P860_9HYPH|nr:CaiB/BaiF CoA-transferase family protein [Mesorhizobium australicum]SMH47234.1 Crotonobetainyl-CoA:carnitine CoA-transferase CaiB [Mesorhizobium australicum]
MSEEFAAAGAGITGSGPLKGVTVLDITRVVAGPFCSMLLADLGATVIKVEHPDDPDYARTFPPFVSGDDEEFSAFFTQFNRNKLGITLDMKSAEGKTLLRKLVRRADVLVENFRPGTMDRLGLGYEVLKKENPRLIYTAISGFGRTGPNASRPSYDNTGQAAGGLWSMNGYADRPPVRVGTIIGDLAASLYAAIGTLAALREAERGGEGQVVDISQQDSVLTLTENAVVRYTTQGDVASPLGNDHPFVRPYGQFPCKDGYVFFGGYTDKFWKITCELFGEPEVANDPEIDTMEKRFDRDVAERRVKPILERWFSKYTKVELEELAGDRVPLSAIKTIAEVVEDPHIAARDMIVKVPVAGKLVRMFGLPIKLSGTPGNACAKAPNPGEHNTFVYSRLVGLTPEEVRKLSDEGVI